MMQQKLDFDRAYQRGLLEAATIGVTKLARPGGSDTVSGKTAKLLLFCIDTHGRGKDENAFCSVDRMSREMNCTPRTVMRAIRAMEERSLLLVKRKGRSNCYTIVWNELIPLCAPPANPPVVRTTRVSTGDIAGSIGDMVSSKGDMVSSKGDMVSSKGDMVSPQSYESQKEPHPTEERAGADLKNWKDVADRLRSLTPRFDRWPVALRLAKEAGLSPSALDAIVDEFLDNRSKFTAGPGAIIVRLREECWPVPIRSREDLAMDKQRKAQRDLKLAKERAEMEAARSRPMPEWSAEELAEFGCFFYK
jgi:AraC-like DNA-binding protein